MVSTYYIFTELSHDWSLEHGTFFGHFSIPYYDFYYQSAMFNYTQMLYLPAIPTNIGIWVTYYIFTSLIYYNPFDLYIVPYLLVFLNFWEIVALGNTMNTYYISSEFFVFQEYHKVYLNIFVSEPLFYHRYVTSFKLRSLMMHLQDFPRFHKQSKKIANCWWEKKEGIEELGLNVSRKLMYELLGHNYVYKSGTNFSQYLYFDIEPYYAHFHPTVYEAGSYRCELITYGPPIMKEVAYGPYFEYLGACAKSPYKFNKDHLLHEDAYELFYYHFLRGFLNRWALYFSYYLNLSVISNNIILKSWFFLYHQFIGVFCLLFLIYLYYYFFKHLFRFILNIYRILDNILNYSYRKFNSIEFEIIKNSNSNRTFKLVTVIFIIERLISRLKRTGYFGNFDQTIISVWFMLHKWFTGATGLAYFFRIFYIFFYSILYTMYMFFFFYFYKHFFSRNFLGITLLIFCKYYIFLCHVLFNVFMTPTILRSCWSYSINILNYFVIWYFLNVNFVSINMFSNKYHLNAFYFHQIQTYKQFPLDYSPLFYKFF